MGYAVKDYYPTEGCYYHHQTCFWCYHFLPDHRKNGSLEIVYYDMQFSDGIQRTDYMFRVGNTSYYFDPDDEEAWGHVLKALPDRVEGEKLERCCRDAVTCCEDALSHQPTGDPYECPGTWDGWVCFPATPTGTTVNFACPDYAYTGYPECALEGAKQCLHNGTWAQDAAGTELTEYASCSHRRHHLVAYTWDASTHAVSLLALPPALALLLSYRQLRVQRFYLHANLFLALLGKTLFNLLDIVVLRIPEYEGDSTHLDDNTVGCRVLVFLAKGFSMAVWTWMLAESIYLHRLIVTAFKGGGKTWAYLLVGWVSAAALTVAWAAGKAVLEDVQCWLGDDHATSHSLYLIFDLPKLLILTVNTIFLANMTRLLMTKLRGVNADHATATRTTVKATIFLMPMFGLQFLLTLYLPPASSPCSLHQVYFFVASALDGFQGLYVAVVYCFINKEVRLQVRRSLYHMRGRLHAHDRSSAAHDPRTDVSLLSASHASTTAAAATAETSFTARS